MTILLFVLTLLLSPMLARAGTAIPGTMAGDANFVVAERAIETPVKVMVNADTVFTITGGPIEIIELVSVCVTANDATASTMQWQSVPTVGTATTISGASATLASATAGSAVYLAPATLATAPTIVTAAGGGLLLSIQTNKIIVKDGTLKLVIGVGSTTGTWKHLLRYKPLTPSATVN